MNRYRLNVVGRGINVTKYVKAKSPLKAKEKFYSSKYHQKTEAMVKSIKRLGVTRRKPRKKKGFLESLWGI